MKCAIYGYDISSNSLTHSGQGEPDEGGISPLKELYAEPSSVGQHPIVDSKEGVNPTAPSRCDEARNDVPTDKDSSEEDRNSGE